MRIRASFPAIAISIVGLASLAYSAPVIGSRPSSMPSSDHTVTTGSTQVMPSAVDDGAGGMFTAWLDQSGDQSLVYVQRLTPDGMAAPGWLTSGMCVSAGTGYFDNVSMVSDGSGGAYIAYDTGDYYGSVGLKHIDAGGAVLAWSNVDPSKSGGVSTRSESGGGNQPQKHEVGDSHPVMVPDGAGGVYFAWLHCEQLGFDRSYLQRFSGSGAVTPVWSTAIQIASWGYFPVLARDGSDGVFVAWSQYQSSGFTTGINHFTAGGALAAGWSDGGTQVCDATIPQVAPALVSDGAGGVIVAWADSRDTHDQIFAQRVTADGSMLWPTNGICVCSQPLDFGPNRFGWYGNSDGRRGSLVSDGAGGALAVWTDYRTGGTDPSDIYAQRINAEGSIAAGWPIDGVSICSSPGAQRLPAIAPDGLGGAWVAWQDGQAEPSWSLRSRHVSASAQPLPGEAADGLVITLTPSSGWPPAISPDGANGALVAWVDQGGAVPIVSSTHLVPGGGSPSGYLVSALALTSDLNPAREGRTVTLTAAVSPPLTTGSVAFYEMGRRFDTAPIVGGVATTSHLLTQTGLQTLSAVYSGDAAFAPAGDFVAQQVIPRNLTTLAVASSRNPELVGRTVMLTVTISPPTASGTVEVFDSGRRIGTGAFVDGVATIPHALPATAGEEPLQATYPGDTACAAATASYTQEVLTRFRTLVGITSSASPSHTLDVDLTASVSPIPYAGAIVFSDDDGTLATVPLVDGAATLHYHAPRFCTRTVTAAYPGDESHLPFVGIYPAEFIGRPTTTTLMSSASPDTVDQPFTLTASVLPASATGTVRFLDFAGGLLASVPILDGVATFPWRISAPASGFVTATYSGDTTFSESSDRVGLDVIRYPTITTLMSSLNPSPEGTRVTLTAIVNRPLDVGTITIHVDGNPVATSTAAGGIATFVTGTLSVGAHVFVAEYSGTPLIEPSRSDDYTQIVDARSPYLRVIVPNDGEAWTVGSPVEIRWDPLNRMLVTRVSLYVSRTDPPVWEPLAENVPNNGLYRWTVTGPGRNPGAPPTALVQVVDPAGAFDGDVSDMPFSIIDSATEAVVTRLDAESFEAGIRVSWALGIRVSVASITLERSPAEVGPWNPVAVEIRDEAGLFVAEDRAVDPGRIYWYRLVATGAHGAQTIFGPVSVEAGGPREFALSSAWPNPSRGPLAMTFTVATHARVKIGVVDVTGREVSVLTEGDYAPGRYQVDWDGRNAGVRMPAGVYFVRYQTPGRWLTQRVMIVP